MKGDQGREVVSRLEGRGDAGCGSAGQGVASEVDNFNQHVTFIERCFQSADGGDTSEVVAVNRAGQRDGCAEQASHSDRSSDSIVPTEGDNELSPAFGQDYMFVDDYGQIEITGRLDTGRGEVPQLSRFPLCPGDSSGKVELERPRVADVLSSTYPGLAGIYDRVRMSATPNYRGCNIPVPSGLNIQAWRPRAGFIKDKSLIDMLECGFPTGFTGNTVPRQNLLNHGSGVRYPADISKFLEKECRLGAMMGPFTAPPFREWNRLNPPHD